MKTKAIIPAVIAIAAALITPSCANRQSDITKGLTPNANLELATFSDTTIVELPALSNDLGMTAYGTITANGLFPVKWGDYDIQSLQLALMELAFGTSQPTLKEAIDYAALHPGIGEEEDNVKIAIEPLKSDSAMSEQSTVISLKSATSNLLVFNIFQSNYPYGAAHGIYGNTYLTYYAPSQTVLTVDNTFEPNSHEEIITAIRQAAAQQYDRIDTMVNPEEIEHYNNFYPTSEGYNFVYAPYEIAPYSSGEITVEVSAYTIYDYLTPLGREALGY